jgi:hypothetical protein
MILLIDQIDALLSLFKPFCRDAETLMELKGLLRHEGEWPKAHYLFTRIRTKTLNAIKCGDHVAEAQYCFEEVCAQTIYNLSAPKKPFEPDTPYWVIPIALKLAAILELDSRKIVEIVTS